MRTAFASSDADSTKGLSLTVRAQDEDHARDDQEYEDPQEQAKCHSGLVGLGSRILIPAPQRRGRNWAFDRVLLDRAAVERTVPTLEASLCPGMNRPVERVWAALKIGKDGHEVRRPRDDSRPTPGRSARHAWSVAATAVVFLSITATTLAIPAAATAKETTTPQGWVAYSAYGLQLSVSKSWAVAYFRNCPEGGVGTLLIGTPTVLSYCQDYPVGTNIVWMQPEKAEAVPASHEQHFVIHGLRITSYSVGGSINWGVRSKNIVLTAEGPGSSTVLRTLTLATSLAQAAPGMLNGDEYLEAVRQTPVTGPVSVVRLGAHGPSLPAAQAFDGHFSDTLPPGTYQLTGHDGNAACPSITTIVQSGRRTAGPLIDCQGV